MSLDDLPNLIILSPSLNKNPCDGIVYPTLYSIQRITQMYDKRLITIQIPAPNKIALLEPTLNSRLPVIISPALDTFKASRSSTYFLLVKCLSLAGTVSLFVVASFVSSTAWDQLTTSSPTYMGG